MGLLLLLQNINTGGLYWAGSRHQIVDVGQFWVVAAAY